MSRFARAAVRAVSGVSLFGAVIGNSDALAGDVKNVVSDLFGGGGIGSTFFILDPTGRLPTGLGGHSTHFETTSLAGLEDLGSSVASGVRLPAFNANAASFTFDVETGMPVRLRDTLGPLLIERVRTIGARTVNVALSYTRVNFTTLDGQGLDNLSLLIPHDDSNGDGMLGGGPIGLFDFELDQLTVDLDVDIEEDIFAAFATYGVTRKWDVGVVVPIIHIKSEVVGRASIMSNALPLPIPVPSIPLHAFDATGTTEATSRNEEEATGIGDLILRSKYDLSDMMPDDTPWWPDVAVVGQATIPTGDTDDLLGRGDLAFETLLIASETFDWFTPTLNLGYEVSQGGRDDDSLRYGVAFDAKVGRGLTTAIGVIGRWEPHGDDGEHLVDLAFGAKWDPFGLVPLNTVIQIPINKDTGLRPNLTWTVGLEYNF